MLLITLGWVFKSSRPTLLLSREMEMPTWGPTFIFFWYGLLLNYGMLLIALGWVFKSSRPTLLLSREMQMPTWRPTFIFFCRAPFGNTAWTLSATVELRTPPSGPISEISCRKRDTRAKNWGISAVRIRWIRRSFIMCVGSNWPWTVKIRVVVMNSRTANNMVLCYAFLDTCFSCS